MKMVAAEAEGQSSVVSEWWKVEVEGKEPNRRWLISDFPAYHSKMSHVNTLRDCIR